ncbi:MAG: AbrB/MazE/SpoVT family DNA-binding domain-containing protein [Bacteroidota bacterium]|jgi:AbrB family looped-hinge helix DNA binding protein
MSTSSVTVKGQVVIPSKLRQKYGIRAGTRVRFYEEKDGIRIIPITPEFIRANVGFLGTKGKLLRALMEEKKREREL